MDVRFVDCRFGTGRPEGAYDAYLAAHVPGAAYVDVETELTGTVGGGRHPLPDAEAFARVASRVGVGPDTLVVAYDEGSGWAARLWWLLRHYGHDLASVVDLRAWRGPLRGGEEEIAPAAFVPYERQDDTITAEEILARLDDPALVLVDARAPERWRGEVEPIDKVAGRIPGARNLPFDRAFPPPPELLAAPELVAYCGSGVTACPVLLSLHLAGRTDARLYPGSWSDWSTRGFPSETG